LARLAWRESARLARRKPETNTVVSVLHRRRDKEISSYYRRTPARSRVEVKAEEVVAGALAAGYWYSAVCTSVLLGFSDLAPQSLDVRCCSSVDFREAGSQRVTEHALSHLQRQKRLTIRTRR
jgi:hypothetical protein